MVAVKKSLPHGPTETLVLLRVVVLQADLQLHRLAEVSLILGRLLEHFRHHVVESLSGDFACAHLAATASLVSSELVGALNLGVGT